VATFLPNSSKLDQLDQSGDFRYESGERKAKAEQALLDQPNNIITLLGGARMSDSNGTADADKIVMNQMSGDFTAEGHVISTRMPDKKKDNSGGGMLSEDEPLHARAKKMISTTTICWFVTKAMRCCGKARTGWKRRAWRSIATTIC
jgi:hypothetical protein